MPNSAARACNSQSSLRSQVWHSPLCSESSSSTTARRASRTRRRVGEHLHALADGHGAGGDEVPRSFDLDHAHAAGPDGLQPFDKAQGGDADAGFFRAARMVVPSGTSTETLLMGS